MKITQTIAVGMLLATGIDTALGRFHR